MVEQDQENPLGKLTQDPTVPMKLNATVMEKDYYAYVLNLTS